MVRTALRFSLSLVLCLLGSATSVTAQLIDRQRVLDAINALPTVTIPRETCNADGTPNGGDEDGDGAFDEICKAAPVPTCTFALSVGSVQVSATGGIGTVTVTATPTGCSSPPWTVSSPVSWVQVVGSATGSGTASYTVSANTGPARSTAITIAGVPFTVNQAGVIITPPTGEIVFGDDFEHVVGRSDTTAPQLFLQRGWTQVKTQQTASGAGGYFYTTTTVPGFTGTFPGGGSRVLAIEMLPQTFGGQTDMYLGVNDIPGDVWFQYWIYITPQSTFGCREKWFYVSGDGQYPSHSHKWMLMTGACAYTSEQTMPIGFPSVGQFLFALRNADGVSTIFNGQGDPNARGNFGQSNPTPIRHSRWVLVKHHIRTTSTTGNQWETWIREVGGAWLKVADWTGGVTPNVIWDIPAAYVGGHRTLRFPTTVDYNKTFYLDNFVIARTERALPVY